MSEIELLLPANTDRFSHADLVKRACRWLRNSRRCGVVLAGLVATYCSEIPDAIGWKAGGESTLIEVKVSRSDFHRDRHKVRTRFPEISTGCYRFYMTPRGLLRLDDLPDGWGLLEVHGSIVRTVKKATRSQPRIIDELSMLVSALRRYQEGDPTIHYRQYGECAPHPEPAPDRKAIGDANRQRLLEEMRRAK